MKHFSIKSLRLLLAILMAGTIVSCSDINIAPVNNADQADYESTVYRIDLADMGSIVEKVSLNEIRTGRKFTGSQRSPNQHTNGDIVVFDIQEISFSAMVNNGGVHGEVNMALIFDGLLAESDCLLVEGNHAVVGARITEVGDPDFDFFIGQYLYFQVIDNGEGSNAPEDQMYTTVFIEEFLDCEQMCPSCVDYEEFGPPVEISSGNIQVK